MSSCCVIIIIITGNITIGRGYPAEEDDFPPPAPFCPFFGGASLPPTTLLHFTSMNIIRMESSSFTFEEDTVLFMLTLVLE